MRIGFIGAGKIGGNLARLLAVAGHDVLISYSRDPDALGRLAAETGAGFGDPDEAAAFGEVVVVSVPWGVFDDALAQAGGPDALAGRIVIDTTNQFGPHGLLDLNGTSAARLHAEQVPAARWAKAFNTLTAGFQRSASGRTGPDRAVMFFATDDDAAAPVVAGLIDDAGFDPVRTGTLDRTDVGHQEPRGDLYGEEFHHDDALALVRRLRGTPPSGRGRP